MLEGVLDAHALAAVGSTPVWRECLAVSARVCERRAKLRKFGAAER
jgi:hypothetical protein